MDLLCIYSGWCYAYVLSVCQFAQTEPVVIFNISVFFNRASFGFLIEQLYDFFFANIQAYNCLNFCLDSARYIHIFIVLSLSAAICNQRYAIKNIKSSKRINKMKKQKYSTVKRCVPALFIFCIKPIPNQLLVHTTKSKRKNKSFLYIFIYVFGENKKKLMDNFVAEARKRNKIFTQ